MMNYRKQQLINEMIEKAVREQIASVAFANPEHRNSLYQCVGQIANTVGHRITQDIGRARRLVQLCKIKKVRA